MSLFSRGYDDVKKAKKEQEERGNQGFELFDFFVAEDGGEAPFMFLTEEPVNWDSHTYQTRNGRYNTVLCTGDDCKFCNDNDRPRFVGSYLVLDLRPYTYEKDGEEITKEYQVKLYTQGTRVLSQLDRLSSKYGLKDKLWNLVRIGKSTSTTYTFEREEEQELTEEKIREVLPEFLGEDYDGTMESLYNIVEEQIKMKAPEGNLDTKENAEKEEEDMKDKLVGTGDKEDKKKKSGKSALFGSSKSKSKEKKKSKDKKEKKSRGTSLFKSK
jgi:hypothetical protein